MLLNKYNKLLECKIAKRIVICIAPFIPIVVLLLLNKMQYSIVDDIHMNIYARGGFEKGSIRDTFFVHPILARIWRVLFAFNNNIDWMALTFFGLIVVCTIILIVLLNKHLKFWQSIILAYLIEIIILGWLTYTVMVYFVTISGIALLVNMLDREKNRVVLIVLGILLVDMGFMLRRVAFISALILAIPYIVYSLKKYMGKNNNKKMLIVLLSAIILLCATNISAGLLINIDKVNHNYKKWDEARIGIVDYNISKYEDNDKLYKSIGFSENDYMGMTYQGGYLADNNVYSYENLKTIIKKTPINVRYNFNALSILIDMAKIKELWLFALALIISFLITSKKKLIVFQGAITILMIIGLFFINRCPERVYIPILTESLIILMLIALQYQNAKTKFKTTHFVVGITVIISIIALASCIQLYKTNKEIESADKKYESLCNFAKHNKDKLFILNSCAFITRREKMKIYGEKEKYDNFMSLFGYELYSPMYYSQAERFHFKNKDRLLMNIVDNDNTYYVDIENKFSKYVIKYLEEHSRRKINYRAIKKEKDYSIYKISYGE